MNHLVQFAKALADPTRVRILAILRDGDVCVCEIVDVLGIPQSSLSTHLQTLRQAGVVNVTKRGTWAYYSIDEAAKPLLAEIEAHFGLRQDQSVIDASFRLEARLALRECNCCVKGAGQLFQIGGKR